MSVMMVCTCLADGAIDGGKLTVLVGVLMGLAAATDVELFAGSVDVVVPELLDPVAASPLTVLSVGNGVRICSTSLAFTVTVSAAFDD